MRGTAVAVLLGTVGCATADPAVRADLSWSWDTASECQPLDAITATAVPRALDLWREQFDVTIIEGFADDTHPVTFCYVERVPYDAPPGFRAVGRTFRDPLGSRILLESGRGLNDTISTVAHELGHVVSWSAEHSSRPGIFSPSAGPIEWSAGDVEYFEALGL